MKLRADEFFSQDLTKQTEGLSKFQQDCILDVKEIDNKIKNDQEWKPLLKNLLLALTIFGSPIAIASMVFRVSTGHYLFFDNKFDQDMETSKEVIQNVSSDSLLV